MPGVGRLMEKGRGGGLSRKAWAFISLQVLVFCCVSIFGVNGYHYGVWDHSITVPLVKASMNKDLYPGDYLFSAERYYYTFLWKGLGLVARVARVDLAALFLGCYVLSLFATFLAFYLIALTLFGKWEIASLACCLLVFSKETLADASTLESILLTRTAVLPLLLFSIYLFLNERLVGAFVLLGAGFLIHPMTAFYVAFMLVPAAAARIRDFGARRLLACLAIFAAIASPIFIWKALRSPPSLGLFRADPAWVRLLELRSPHHTFPFSWPPREYLEAGLVALLFVGLVSISPPSKYRRTIVSFSIAVALLCLLGVIFSEVVPMAAVLLLQPLRSFQFLVYFAIIYYSAFLFARVEDEGKPLRLFIASLLSAALLFDAHAWKPGVAALVAATAFVILGRSFFRMRPSARVVSAVLAAAIMIAGFAGTHRSSAFTVGTGQDGSWLEVERWARLNTDVSAVFIVPPRIEGFRVDSERAIYADWKDGTMLNFDPAFGLEWRRRLERLGVRTKSSLDGCLARLTERDFMAIRTEDLARSAYVFLVDFRRSPHLAFPVRYQNAVFLVYEIPRR